MRHANRANAHTGKINHNEKTLRETQTLRAGCSKAEPKISAPQTRSLGRGTAKI